MAPPLCVPSRSSIGVSTETERSLPSYRNIFHGWRRTNIANSISLKHDWKRAQAGTLKFFPVEFFLIDTGAHRLQNEAESSI